MTTAVTADATLGQLVTDDPARSGVLESLGLDYCCGGDRTLADACREKGLDPDDVLRQLTRITGEKGASGPNPADMSLTELADHIEETHHVYLRETLPVLRNMTAKVARAHGERDDRLHEVEQVMHELADELESHMMKEERVLFPAIRRLDAGQSLEGFACGALSNPIDVMELEHDNAGHALERLHTLTDGYAVPDWACNTYRGLMAQFDRFEKDMHLHIHKENNILFPRTLAKESDRSE